MQNGLGYVSISLETQEAAEINRLLSQWKRENPNSKVINIQLVGSALHIFADTDIIGVQVELWDPSRYQPVS